MDSIDMQYGIYGKKSERSLIFIRSGGDREVTQTFIYNYHKEGTGAKSFSDTRALRFFTPLSRLLPLKKKWHTVKNHIFKVFAAAYGSEEGK